MKIKVETFSLFEYSEIEKLYGHILKEFNLCEENNRAYIIINLDDIQRLDKMLNKYIYSDECNDDSVYGYYGILFHTEDNEFQLKIQDNYS